MRDWVQKVVKSKKFFVVAAALVAMQPLYGVFVAPTASAASDVAYTVQSLDSGWLPDRTSPSGGYGLDSFGGRNTLRIGIDNTSASASEGFYRTEGVKRLTGEADVIKADLYIDGDWIAGGKDVRAGLWGVGYESDMRNDNFPIVEFTRTDDFTGWRIWHSDGTGWQNLGAGFLADAWNSLTLMRNKVDTAKTDVYINGVMVGQGVGYDTEYYGEMILNSYNYAVGSDKDYEVHWSNIQTGEYVLNADYILPTNSSGHFRPVDNPLRLKIDDEAEQFHRLQLRLYDANTNDYKGVYSLARGQCNTAQAGNYVLCDIKNADAWGGLIEGAYIARLTAWTTWSSKAVVTAGMSQYWSQPFVVDTTAPAVDSFALENPTSGFATTSATVSATASDASGVESVNFYITTPREDGTCTGNGAKLAETRVWAADGDGKHRTTLDTSSLADGEYCITAVARDHAKSNSSLRHIKVVVDKTAPTLQVTAPSENAVFGGNDQIVVTSYMEDAWGLDNYFVDINSAEVTLLSDPAQTETLPEATTTETTSAEAVGLTVVAIYNAADFANGEYVITVRVSDKAGNVSEETRAIFIDHSVPTPGQGMVPPLSEETDEAVSELAQLAERLTQPFSVPLNFASSTGDAQTNQDVLGTQQDSEKEVASGEQSVAVAPSAEGWKIFGIAWYWWLLVAAILGVVTAWIMRRRNANGV